LNLELTTFEQLSTLWFRFEFRFDNFRKVVKSWFRFDNFRKVVKSWTGFNHSSL